MTFQVLHPRMNLRTLWIAILVTLVVPEQLKAFLPLLQVSEQAPLQMTYREMWLIVCNMTQEL